MATKTAGTDKDAIRQITAARAYTIWESEGRPHGRDAQHWERAEAEVLGGGRTRRATTKADSKTAAKVPPKVAAAMTAAAGETQRRTTRATSKATKKTTTGTRKKR